MKDGNKKKKCGDKREKNINLYIPPVFFFPFATTLIFEMHVQGAYGFLNNNVPADWSVVIF